jgi:hypothetical protein
MTDRVILCGIGYRISRPEPWTVIFTEEVGMGNRPTRFMLHRGKGSIWSFQPVDGWCDVPAHHISQAYQWCLARVGDDHSQSELPRDRTIEPHSLAYDDDRKMTYCTACGLDVDDQMQFRSCVTANACVGPLKEPNKESA